MHVRSVQKEGGFPMNSWHRYAQPVSRTTIFLLLPWLSLAHAPDPSYFKLVLRLPPRYETDHSQHSRPSARPSSSSPFSVPSGLGRATAAHGLNLAQAHGLGWGWAGLSRARWGRAKGYGVDQTLKPISAQPSPSQPIINEKSDVQIHR